jgi:hypothetical protein
MLVQCIAASRAGKVSIVPDKHFEMQQLAHQRRVQLTLLH